MDSRVLKCSKADVFPNRTVNEVAGSIVWGERGVLPYRKNQCKQSKHTCMNLAALGELLVLLYLGKCRVKAERGYIFSAEQRAAQPSAVEHQTTVPLQLT